MSSHIHDMKPHAGKIWKCSSCLFRCTEASLPAVKASPGRHRVVKRGSAQAKTVYGR